MTIHENVKGSGSTPTEAWESYRQALRDVNIVENSKEWYAAIKSKIMTVENDVYTITPTGGNFINV